MTRDRAQTRRVPLAVTVLVAAGFGIVGLSTPSSANHQTVTAVRGSAYGYFADVTIFGERTTTGPTPIVNLPPGGSATPIEATAATGRAVAGPGGIATVFSSGPITVRTQGTTGPSGSVTSSARIQNVNTSRNEVFTASEVLGTCTASEAGTSGSTTITGGTLQTDNGDSDTSNTVPDHPATTVNVPANPAPNTAITGHVHIGTAQDDFRYVFNEQIVNPDGSITVNAAHQYLLGPTAVGELIVGQSVCGVTATPTPPPPADSSAPKVVRTVPAANATGIAPGANVNAFFSEAMKGVSVNGTTFKLFRRGSTTKVGASVSYNASTHQGILNPTKPLIRGATYKAVVTTFARDLSGNRLDQNATLSGLQQKTWSFKIRN